MEAGRLRVLFVTRAYYPAVKYGGPVAGLRRMATMLAAAGHEVTVLCQDMAEPGMFGERLRPGRFVMDGVRVRYFRTRVRARWDGIAPAAIGEVPDHVRCADVVHVCGTRHFLGYLAERASQRMGIPYVVMPEGSVPPRIRSLRAKEIYDRAWTRKAMVRAFRVIATSDAEGKDLIQWGLPPDRVLVLPPRGDRISPSSERRDVLRDRWGVPRTAFVLIWMGRIHSEKGLSILFSALEDARLQEVHLLLGGAAEDRDLDKRLGELASSRLQGRVHFLGWVDQFQKSELFRLGDLFVLPSKKENFGLAAAEALASGMPVVVTEGCGIADLVREERAGLVSRYSPTELADALARVLGLPALLEQMREATAQAAVRLDWPPLVAYLEDIYRKAHPNNP